MGSKRKNFVANGRAKVITINTVEQAADTSTDETARPSRIQYFVTSTNC